jgi:glycine/D-amino acid oxidase-like deaminating enzyme
MLGAAMPNLTAHRDLHGGVSPWQQRRVTLPPRKALHRDRHCDVLVVGAGISGAMVAEALSASGLHVICCDRRMPADGATAASTAMVMSELDTPLLRLARRMRRADAERIWRRSFLAVHALRERVALLGIEAEVAERRTLYLQGDVLDARGLRAEAAARERAGFQVSYLTAAQVHREYGIRARAALRCSGALEADPRQLTAGFLRAAVARGAELLCPEEIVQVKPHRAGVRASTRSGHHIVARDVVLATGYELHRCVPSRGHRIISTWAIATQPQPRAPWPGPDLIWEAASPYLYLRTTAEGRVLCGGGDESITAAAARDARLPAKAAWLRRRLAALLPRIDTRISHAWAGSFGVSTLGLPTIGEIPGMPHCFAVLGYGGNGITFSMVAAQMLRNRLAGAGDAELDLLAFGRGK